MQQLFKQIRQWFAKLFGLLVNPGSNRSYRNYSKERQELSQLTGLADLDYEFLFSQLLEGVAHGWHEGRILKFFQNLGERGRQRYWVDWLERFGERVLASPSPNQQLAVRMLRLGELARSFPSIERIGQASYAIGRQLYSRNVSTNLVWEYDGPDLVMPVSNIESEPSSAVEVEAEAPAVVVQPQGDRPADTEETVETLTIEQLLHRLQQDPTLAEQMAQQLALDTTNPQEIVEKLVEQFQSAQQNLENQPAPNSIEAWFERGLQQANLGDLQGAIASWENALALNPNLAQAWHNRGSALAHLGRLEEAIASYNKAVELNPEDLQAWNARAYALFNLQRWEEAIICWDKVIELQPDSADIWYNRGCALENWGKNEQAKASYVKALEVQPDFEPAKAKLAEHQSYS
jgi:tetratricopeptide (TPR) repeat protein